MVRKYSQKRRYKKRAYKKRVYKRRYYKRRYYKPIKKPEIHILESSAGPIPFNNSSGGVGTFHPITAIGNVQPAVNYDNLVYTIHGKSIEGRKIRLKYLYIKGYIKVGVSTAEDADDFNCKLMLFRWKRNTINSQLLWGNLINNTDNIDLTNPSTWTEDNRLSLMYKQDWKNDIKINFYKKVKNLYRKYDDANNIIPFKMRISLYDCVMTCDSYKNTADNTYYAHVQPSTNGLYFTFLSNKYDANTTITYKYKLYYTDY